MAGSQSNRKSESSMRVQEETASVTFTPLTKDFKAHISTRNIFPCILILGIIWLLSIIFNKLDKLTGYSLLIASISSILLIGLLVCISVLRLRSPVIKADKSLKTVHISTELLTTDSLHNLLAYMFGNPSKNALRLPEPDAKYDAQADKKIDFSNDQEKKEILEEQEKIITEVTKKLKEITDEKTQQKISREIEPPQP